MLPSLTDRGICLGPVSLVDLDQARVEAGEVRATASRSAGAPEGGRC